VLGLVLLVPLPATLATEPSERDALELIAKLGGSVYRDPAPLTLPGKEPRTIVTGVVLTDRRPNRKLADADLKTLAVFTDLQVLDLSSTRVTDQGLKYLAPLKKLRKLGLARTQITDMGLKEVQGLTSLQALDLSGTKVTDGGVATLQKTLPRCKIVR